MEHDASMDVDTFISEIQSRPAIWDLNSNLYSNRNEKAKAWEEICELFIDNFKDKSIKEKNSSATMLQRKWKSLRDCFNREIGKQKKSGSAASCRKEYIYFKQLSFLKPLKNVRPTGEENKENDPGEQLEQQLEQQQEKSEEETSTTSFTSSKRRGTKRNIDKIESEILKQLSDNIKNKYERTENVDPDKDFLISVLPDIKKIHDDFKIDFKTEMLKLIKKFKSYEPIPNYRSCISHSGQYGHSSQDTNTTNTYNTINQVTQSITSPSALSNYSNNSMDGSIIEDMFNTE